MNPGDRRRDATTEMGGTGPSALPPTSLDLLLDCREGARPDRQAALDRLVSLYWKPVYALVRRSWAKSNEDAKDLVQEFFVRNVLGGSLLQGYAPDRGSFRAFLRGAVSNFLRQEARDSQALKRGGGARAIRLDDDGVDIEDLLADRNALAPEEAFDRAWERVIGARALTLARERLVRDGHDSWWAAFEAFDLRPDGAEVSYDDLAKRFAISRETVKVRLARVREALLQAARDLLSETAATPRDLSEELSRLLGR